MLPSLPEAPNLADVLRTFPSGWPPLLEAHDEILRSESPLTIGERELIAAYVSGLNHCAFCFNAHSTYAESYGFSRELCEALVDDLDGAEVAERLRSLLRYARLLTLAPSSIAPDHVHAVLEAGWPERALMDAAMVVALFNFMNRIVLGLGVAPHDDYYARRRAAVLSRSSEEREGANLRDVGSHPYRAYGKQIGIVR